jgi:hypothetical protein
VLDAAFIRSHFEDKTRHAKQSPRAELERPGY